MEIVDPVIFGIFTVPPRAVGSWREQLYSMAERATSRYSRLPVCFAVRASMAAPSMLELWIELCTCAR